MSRNSSVIPETPSDYFDEGTWRSVTAELKKVEQGLRGLKKTGKFKLSSSSRWPEIRLAKPGLKGEESISVQLSEKYPAEDGGWRVIHRFVPNMIFSLFVKPWWKEIYLTKNVKISESGMEVKEIIERIENVIDSIP